MTLQRGCSNSSSTLFFHVRLVFMKSLPQQCEDIPNRVGRVPTPDQVDLHFLEGTILLQGG